MTTENDFLWFANGGSANVQPQATWAAEAAITNGFPSGVLTSLNLNKALRQGTAGSALLAAFMVAQGQAAVDDGNISELLTNFEAALQAFIGAYVTVPNVTVFTSSGTFTVPAGCTSVKPYGVGGGGGGGAGYPSYYGAGGAGGSFGVGRFSVTPGATIAVTIGAGGALGVSNGSNGGSGGTTSFGSFLSIPGGGGGQSATSSGSATNVGTNGGAATGGYLSLVGGNGSLGLSTFNGFGGYSAFGGQNGPYIGNAGIAGPNYGVGGSAGAGANNGGAGAGGILIVEHLP